MDSTMSSLQSERRRNASAGRADFMKMYERKTKMPLLKSPAENSDTSSKDDEDTESVVSTGSKNNLHSESGHSSVSRKPREKQTTRNKSRLTHVSSLGSSGGESGISSSKRPEYSRANIGWQPKHDIRDSRNSKVTILCSDTSSSSSSEAESGSVRLEKNNFRANRGRQPRHERATNQHKRTRSDSTSSSGSSDTDESSNFSTESGNSYSRANIGWQPRHQLNSLRGKDSTNQSSSLSFSSDNTYKSEPVPALRRFGVQLGAKNGWRLNEANKDSRPIHLDSDSSDSSSSDSESLLSPSKTRTLPEEPLPLAQRIRSRSLLQSDVSSKGSTVVKSFPQTDSQVDRRDASLSKLRTQPTSNPQALHRRRRHLESGTSSSFHGIPTGRKASPNLQQHIPVKRRLNKETEQVPRYKRAKVLPTVDSQAGSSQVSGWELSGVTKTSRLSMVDLFGKTSDDDGNETEEDVHVLKEHEDAFNNKSEKTMHGTPAESVDNRIIPDRAQRKKNQSTLDANDSYSTTQKITSPTSGRDNAVILVDITQSEERGALSGQASPKLNSVKPASSSKISEQLSPVFSRHVPAKGVPTRKQDNESNSEVLVIGEAQNAGTGSSSKKSLHVESPADSHIVLRGYPEAPVLNSPAAQSGKSHLNKESIHQRLTSLNQHPHPKLQPSGHGSASDLSTGRSRKKNTELLTLTRNSERTGLSSRASSSSSKLQASSHDHLHFPQMSFEENRYHWLLQTRGLVPRDVSSKSQQGQGGVDVLPASHSQGHTSGSGPVKVSRSQGLEHHDRVGSNTSSSSTSALAGQEHAGPNLQSEDQTGGLQDVGQRTINIDDGRDQSPRRHTTGPVVSRRTARDPQSEVQVLESSNPTEDSYRLPLKIRRKQGAKQSSNQGRNLRNSGARQEWDDQGGLGSRTSSGVTTDTQPDVQVLESQDDGQRRGGTSSNRRRKRPEQQVSERPESPDIVELVRQLDQDEAMAKQLQEHYDLELARITQQYSPSNSGIYQPVAIHDVDNPAPPPPLPHLHQQSHALPYPQPYPHGMGSFSHQLPGPGQEMTWRDDLMDLNALNTAMMAQMGRFIEDNMETMAGHQPYSRARRGRGRARGRSRGRGRRHNYMQSPVNEGNDYEALLNLAERVGPAVSKGLPESSINLLPTFLYTSGKDPGESECAICMGDYETGENMRRLPCFHFYHAACIDKWLRENRICPVCREEVNFDPVNFM